MAKSESDGNGSTFLPNGLKVRSNASVALDPKVSNLQATVSRGSVELPPFNHPDAPDVALHSLPEPTPQPPHRNGFRPMPVLTVLTLICLGLLWWLGSWQWDKFVSKSRAPTAIAAIDPASVAAALEAPNPEYRPVFVDGLIDSRTIKISSVQNGVRGFRIFAPVLLEAGGIFVDQGFVGESDVNLIVVQSGQVRLSGVLRVGARPNQYTPDNDPAQEVWYWPDLPVMAASLGIASMGPVTGSANGLAARPSYYVSLSKVDPLGTGDSAINPYADSKGANQIEPERHLGYALTWWGFGLALIGVYIGLQVRTGRLRFSGTLRP